MAKKKVKALEVSETRVVKRSEIKKNPINPKRHKEDRIKQQEKNLKKVGYLGGIVWNETTGNLIDGHRRISAMDLYYGYDGTPDTDYEVKVEVVHMDEAEEKQQLAYMAAGDTKADLDLLAEFANDIDLGEIGLEQSEIDDILNIANGSNEETTDLLAELVTPTKKVPEKGTAEYEEAKARVKAGKAKTKEMEKDYRNDEAAHVVLSFSNYDNFVAFCDMMGVTPDVKFVKGEELLQMFE